METSIPVFQMSGRSLNGMSGNETSRKILDPFDSKVLGRYIVRFKGNIHVLLLNNALL